MQSDHGIEYGGNFERYLRLYGISQALTSIKYLCSNGYIEHINGCIRAKICRMMAAFKYGQWWEFLPNMVKALRVFPLIAIGVSPYFIMYKKTHELPISRVLHSASTKE